MKCSKKNLEAIADRLAWYEQLMAGKTMAWQHCGVCTSCLGGCDACAIKPPDHEQCGSAARRDLCEELTQLYSLRKKKTIKKHAKIRYQELIDRLNNNGYEYK